MKKVLRIAAKIFFLITFVFFSAFFIGEGLLSQEIHESGIPTELFVMAISFLVMLIGFIFSFRDGKIGGIFILVGGIFNAAYMIIRGGIGDFGAAAIFGLPFIIVGFIIMTAEDEGLRF